MKKITFETWMNQLKFTMISKKLINSNTILDENGYRPYYDENLSVWEALDCEFGKKWRTLKHTYEKTNPNLGPI